MPSPETVGCPTPSSVLMHGDPWTVYASYVNAVCRRTTTTKTEDGRFYQVKEEKCPYLYDSESLY